MVAQRLKATVCLIALTTLIGCETVQKVAEGAADTFRSATGGLFSAYVDESDVCVAQRRAFVDEASPIDKSIVWGVLGGAATGALVAATTGQNIWAGLAIGAAVGLAAGYFVSLQGEGKSPFQVVNTYTSDVRESNQRINNVIAAFQNIRSCRQNEAQAIKANLAAGAITRETAQTQMAAVRAKYEEDVAEASRIAKRVADDAEGFAAAYNEIAADNGRRGLVVQEYRPPALRSQPSVTVSDTTAVRQTPTEQVASLKVASGEEAAISEAQQVTLSNFQARDALGDTLQVAEGDLADGDGAFTIG